MKLNEYNASNRGVKEPAKTRNTVGRQDDVGNRAKKIRPRGAV